MLLHFVRHGRTFENNNGILQGHRDSRLDEVGEKQAYFVGEKFKTLPITHIYTSDLQRTYQTAQYIHKHHSHLLLQSTDQLREKTFGIYDGKCKHLIAQELGIDDPKYIYDIITTLPGAETAAMADHRAEAFVTALLEEHTTETGKEIHCIVVTHTGFKHHLVKALYYRMKKEVETFLKFKNTAVSTFSITNSTIEELILNDCSHLPEDLLH